MINKNEFRSAVAKVGLTHEELAKRIGMSKNTLSSKLNGKGYFNTEQIDRICEELNIVDDREKINIFLWKPSLNRDENKIAG